MGRVDTSPDAGSGMEKSLLPMLRIALPSWRTSNANWTTLSKPKKLSRNEMLSLFEKDLKVTKFGPGRLTDHEKWQMDVAARLRAALSRQI